MQIGGEVVLRDDFGKHWRIRLARPGAKLAGPNDAWAVRSLLYFTLAQPAERAGGAHVGERLGLILALYDALTGRRLARDIERADSADALLRSWRRDIEETLVCAVEHGTLQVEEIRDEHAPAVHEDDAPSVRPPPPVVDELSTVSLLVVDEVGDPIAGIDVAFGVGNGRKVVPTNGGGVAKLTDVETGFLSAAIANPEQLREKLKPRWTKPRAQKLPQGPDVHVEQIETSTTSLLVEADRPTTLVIAPLFRCNEVDGVHFAFGRSFVLETALDSLSVMAAAILEDEGRRAMIFGHTDTAGTEALNKELSERRARALFTIFTHDTGAWEELWMGTADGPSFKEKWGPKEAQHLLNAFGVLDDDGDTLVEDGIEGERTKAALKRFQRGEYPSPRAARGPIPESGIGTRRPGRNFSSRSPTA